MELTTRCPHCGTTFSASLEQLQLRKGYIRCVQCATIFDGYEAVVSSEDARLTPPRSEAGPSKIPVEPRFNISDTGPAVIRVRPEFTVSERRLPSERGREPSLGTDNLLPEADRGAGLAPHPAPNEPAVVLESVLRRRSPSAAGTPADMGRHEPRFVHYERPSGSAWDGRWHRMMQLFWMGLSLLGLLLLVLQLAYVFRAQLAQSVPELRPALEQLCDRLGCEVAYARRIEQVSIVQSSLQRDRTQDGAAQAEADDSQPAAQDAQSDAYVLQFNLRNTFNKPQEWPTVVLELRDASGALIARKHLPAQMYLTADRAQGPFPAGSEHQVHLPMTLQDLKVNGYQLSLFFP